MSTGKAEWLHTLFAELRKESLEASKMRSQTIGFKITFVSASLSLILGNIDKAFSSPTQAFVKNSILLSVFIPAYAAVCFDFLIVSYSITISRIGLYCHKHIENSIDRPTPNFKFWEEFMYKHRVRHRLAVLSNAGFTGLTIITADIVTFRFFPTNIWVISLLATLILLYFYALGAFTLPQKIVDEKSDFLIYCFMAKPKLARIEKKYCEKRDEVEVLFVLQKKAARTVHLVGNFNDWDHRKDPMKKGRDGSFSIKKKLKPFSEYQFRYLINGCIWENHWNADRYIKNSFGSENSVVET